MGRCTLALALSTLALSTLALSTLAAAPDLGDPPPPPPTSGPCRACVEVMGALGDALAVTRSELDVFKDAKQEAIGRVQKAQTRRWLKQEYGSALYSSVEDAMEKVCALPTLGALRRECEKGTGYIYFPLSSVSFKETHYPLSVCFCS
ncbi:hypothetical protein T492DRAFT_39519 [Pavlovales sp. CCMP2436]|nr:hypothetical protein T492DRAFT_39519 [Pavlovales sp. CCMP2436]